MKIVLIIKSKSYKNLAAVQPIFEYLLRDSEQEGGFVITKFIKGNDHSPQELAKQFKHNEESYRLNKRSNQIVMYMDILSFHELDGHIPNSTLQKITKKYLSLKAPRSIAVATVHRHEKSHTHLHICYGIEYRTGVSVRVSKTRFREIKIEMEAYSKQFNLTHSAIDHSKSVKKKC